jgi:hypothetical protein
MSINIVPGINVQQGILLFSGYWKPAVIQNVLTILLELVVSDIKEVAKLSTIKV